MRLRRNQLCPIHHSRFCCGREAIPKQRTVRQIGVRRIEDPHHPRGYRELRSNGEMRKLMNRKIALQHGKCAICEKKFTDYADVVPTTSTRAASAAHGETITTTTFRPCTGDATAPRDPVGSERKLPFLSSYRDAQRSRANPRKYQAKCKVESTYADAPSD
jgi:hypothetical protein